MIYQISSGQGPVECERGVAKLLEYIQKLHEITVLDFSEGYNPLTYKSVRFSTPDDLSDFVGSVQWVWQSTYRPEHKRKNWFIDFSECPIKFNDSSMDNVDKLDEKELTFETFRSGGKGGQNVNKVETGVRAIYKPNGLSAVCTEERSQFLNKEKAIAKIKKAIKDAAVKNEATAVNEAWKRHTSIVRGDAVKKFKGIDFKLVK